MVSIFLEFFDLDFDLDESGFAIVESELALVFDLLFNDFIDAALHVVVLVREHENNLGVAALTCFRDLDGVLFSALPVVSSVVVCSCFCLEESFPILRSSIVCSVVLSK